jgi:hypothetical protein
MDRGLQGLQVYDFPHLYTGISVIVPDQGGWVKVIVKDLPPANLPGTESFTPIRVLANIAVTEYDDESKILTTFNPPIELAAAYLSQDLHQAARHNRPLKLAYWDGVQWVVFTPEEHHFVLLAPTTGAIGKVTISGWAGDPPVAWGV